MAGAACRRLRYLAAVLIAAVATAAGAGQAAEPSHWIATWYAAQQNRNEPPRTPDEQPHPVLTLADCTLRQIVHLSSGGDAVRVRLSNLFGSAPVTFAAVGLARSAGGSAIDMRTNVALTFAGRSAVTIPAGEAVWSDAVPFSVTAHTDLAVSLYLPAPAEVATEHATALQTNYKAAGDRVAAAALPGADTLTAYFWLAGVDVAAAAPARVLVTFGDSITDGRASTPGTNRRWSNRLDDRLRARAPPGIFSVVNAGIAGNRWLHDSRGPSGASRFGRDVLDISGATDVILLLGINDIGVGAFVPGQRVAAGQVIAAIGAAAQRARARGLRVYLGTLLPFEGSDHFTAGGEAGRQAINRWIRTNTRVNGVIDFDRAMRDPSHPARLLPAFDSGDHIHPNDAGHRAMAAAIDLHLLR